jgi:prepilin-type N-terminal cleavage/methylation domain-containing protein
MILVNDKVFHKTKGFTLVEILVVVVIIGLVSGGIIFGFGSVFRERIKSSAVELACAVKFLFSRALARGEAHRLVLDLDKEKYWFEFTTDSFLIDLGSESPALGAGVEEEREESSLFKEFGSIPRFKRAVFSPLQGERYRPRTLKKGIDIEALFIQYWKEPITRGKGFIYFFPFGMTQKAVIHLRDRRDRVYSLLIHPLTARVKILKERYEPSLEWEEEKEAEDEG